MTLVSIQLPEGLFINSFSASLAHVMSLVADDTDLLARYGDLDCASTQYFHQKLHASGYKLGQDHR
jgi:hypothetical protein